MKKTTLLIVALTVAGLLALTSPGVAGVICTHSGNTDPLSEGFTLATEGAGFTMGPGPDSSSWRVQNPGSPAEYNNVKYDHSTSAADWSDPTGWTATMTAKLNSGPGAMSAMFLAGTWSDGNWIIGLNDGTGGFTEGIYNNWGPPWVKDLVYAMDVTDAYHTYQILYDPATTGQAAVYVDGSPVGTIKPHSPGSGQKLFRFITSEYPGDVQYSFAQLETGQHVIPEPGTLALLATGLMGLALYAWRRRK